MEVNKRKMQDKYLAKILDKKVVRKIPLRIRALTVAINCAVVPLLLSKTRKRHMCHFRHAALTIRGNVTHNVPDTFILQKIASNIKHFHSKTSTFTFPLLS